MSVKDTLRRATWFPREPLLAATIKSAGLKNFYIFPFLRKLIYKDTNPLMYHFFLRREANILVQLFVISHQQEFPSRISLRLPAKDHRADRASAHAFSYLLPLCRPTLIFAYELPDSPRHLRWLQVIHLPTQKPPFTPLRKISY
ncbi:hypothetical protein PUN28_002543 [Cardiocondyla obscurior]|uniref:Uncharacterized protein n=1 Tax=Cardiocondyla obscurior TaxID=286306 RepID=A0AAW2GV11_9HYME